MAGLIETQYLEDFYRTINLVRGETVTVLRRDGIVIAGYPDIAHRLGRRMPDQSPWYARVAEGGGSYRSPGYLIDIPQIITVHPLRDYPLVVDANVSVQAALANWYRQAAAIAASVIGVAAGLNDPVRRDHRSVPAPGATKARIESGRGRLARERAEVEGIR